MAEQLDLLAYTPTHSFPQQPGHKARSTSRDAARAIADRAPTLRNLALREVRAAGGLTADEVADRLGKSILSIRPRVAELAALGLIYETTERRPNASGHKAIVWKVQPAATAIATG